MYLYQSADAEILWLFRSWLEGVCDGDKGRKKCLFRLIVRLSLSFCLWMLLWASRCFLKHFSWSLALWLCRWLLLWLFGIEYSLHMLQTCGMKHWTRDLEHRCFKLFPGIAISIGQDFYFWFEVKQLANIVESLISIWVSDVPLAFHAEP